MTGGVIKTDKNGAVQWSKTLGSAKKDFLHTAIEYPDGSGYLCMGLSEEDDKNPAHLMYHHGKYDIWITTVTEPNKQIVVKKNYNPMIEGIVKDKKSGRPVKTSLSLIDFYDQDSIESVATNPDNGEYMMLAPIDSRVGKRVSLIAAPLGFFPSSSDILTDSLITIPVWRVNFKLSPLSINERALVPNLVFEQNQTKPNANAGLTALELFMQSNETVKIELNGYATSDENNAVSLSQQRADFVKNYLIQKGINPARVTSKGKGATNSPNLGHGIEMNILAL